jgi:hypothetical protein
MLRGQQRTADSFAIMPSKNRRDRINQRQNAAGHFRPQVNARRDT